ncbi:hypothetical protein [Mucisphaera calidilacus]|uniref:Uncharacterized protein n=1 Tax=Mucisphaera calidilacus TaxID=2527982 RepID=A0A518BVR9_9BACT|nr:hypothetical protein [Mucisphaera calidilacus]QDU71068.1 hypothetical protein Pan265_09130 [Mucisphaera calidilacus]
MARPFDPRKVLKQISNPLLRAFFRRRGELDDVPWDDLTEHKIEPIFEAWQALDESKKLEVQVILRDVFELADHRGRAVLAEEVLGRCPDRTAEFEAQMSSADNAMWVYLHVPEAFDEAAMFARADALAAGRYWNRRNSLPKKAIDVNPALCDRLAQGLTSFYGPTQMRGRHCHVVHYRRLGGGDYFFAYLDDYPDKHLIFDGDSDQPVVRSDRYAFENVFVYNEGDGSMEMFALGGKKVWEPLQTAFCEAVLNEQVAPSDPLRPAYRLDHLLTPDYPLSTDPADGVEQARITLLRIAPPGGGGYIEIKADLKGHRNDIYRKLERWLKTSVVADGTRVLKATFHLRFQSNGSGRQPAMTFSVSAPDSSDLKSKPDEQREVGERCLKLWEVVVDDEQ